MIYQFSTADLLAGGLLFIVFAFVEYALFQETESECEHKHKAIYDSYHKSVCIECLKEFSTEGIKK